MDRLSSEKISSKEVGILDNNAEWLGIPKSHLMECAGYSFAMEIIQRYKLDETSKALIFCGTGNNGGDGFVIGRHLSSFGIKSKILLMGGPSKIRTEEAKLNWEIISESLTHSIEFEIINDSTDIVNLGIILDQEQQPYRIIIDGLLGTGIKGKVREPYATAIEFIDEIREHHAIPIVSIDVPSGYSPDTGEVGDIAVRADLVITFHRNKIEMNTDNEYIKEIVVKSIGIPKEAWLFLGRGDLLPALKYREPDYHKGQFGRMLVIGGSKNYSGAPAYSSLAGINFGCDLVITYTPQVIADVLRGYSPNMIVRSHPGDWLSMESFDEIMWLVDWANSILIGPGMGEEKETEELLVNLLGQFKEKEKKFVLDADALKLIKTHHDLIKGQSCILTPHEGELKIMADIELPSHDKIEDRGEKVYKFAKELDVTVLLKGPYDYVSNGKKLKLNRTGCPEMAIGGTGDVLAGLCTSFVATNVNNYRAACAGAFLNGYVGEYCKKILGPRFTAMDMIEHLTNAIQSLL
ncbi:MAG: putative Bifunctional NAD(P)H-hydrate repair enzyme Nnr [Promethearchaeota archaeon]|nr:MAG: putative Bifunctional NAD(P)H-hydrate repair enzyme Nnr [Candidatus Lokiarchaeota archaeon]